MTTITKPRWLKLWLGSKPQRPQLKTTGGSASFRTQKLNGRSLESTRPKLRLLPHRQGKRRGRGMSRERGRSARDRKRSSRAIPPPNRQSKKQLPMKDAFRRSTPAATPIWLKLTLCSAATSRRRKLSGGGRLYRTLGTCTFLLPFPPNKPRWKLWR